MSRAGLLIRPLREAALQWSLHGLAFALPLWLSACVVSTPYPLFDQDGDGIPTGQDCDDHDPTAASRYPDVDGDGFGAGDPLAGCADAGPGYSSSNDDCDDSDAAVYPGALEVCETDGSDPLDNDCDGQIDEAGSSGGEAWYPDLDGDGHGAGEPVTGCAAPGKGYALSSDDCYDGDATVYPGALEVCDADVSDHPDNDCDGQIDEANDSAGGTSWYLDADGDGYGAGKAAVECTSPGRDYVEEDGDCDDTKSTVHPKATELCDQLDNDCDGQIDEGLDASSTWYADADSDGYGDEGRTQQACAQPAGYVSNPSAPDGFDCDDHAASIHPGAVEVAYDGIDQDCQGGDQIDVDLDGFEGSAVGGEDCDDDDGHIYPGADETCNNLDDDCDGLIDNGVVDAFYPDKDGDGFGDDAHALNGCKIPLGYVLQGGDCDDQDSDAYPGGVEVAYDGIDQDCDGSDLEDVDLDGYTGSAAGGEDCQDDDALIYPGAKEICNSQDDDCNGKIDEGLTGIFYPDADGDHFGDSSRSTIACAAPAGYVTQGGDCDDTDASVYSGALETPYDGIDQDCAGGDLVDVDLDGYAAKEADGSDCNDKNALIHPGVTEVCNGVDEDCDGLIDEGVATVYYADRDADSFGDPGASVTTCQGPKGYVTNGLDCDDKDPGVNPDAFDEIGDLLDTDCDGNLDTINTVAGNGQAAYTYDNVPATATSLNTPVGVLFDPMGSIFIADSLNYRIRKVDSRGIISTIAGNGGRGVLGDGGPATDAQLHTPVGLALDGKGNLFIADSGANKVRVVTTAGVISTVAGTGSKGYNGDSQAATTATLYAPMGVAVDSTGRILIADTLNHRIRRVASGKITTVGGNGSSEYKGDGGPATAAGINSPGGVSIDAAGLIYIVDTGNNVIRVVDSLGTISTRVGTGAAGYTGDGGAAAKATLSGPSAVVFDPLGNLFIADRGNYVIRKVDAEGTIFTVAGTHTKGYSGDGGPAYKAALSGIGSLSIDSAGSLLIGDSGNQRVRRIVP